jgi:hypothetical protein
MAAQPNCFNILLAQNGASIDVKTTGERMEPLASAFAAIVGLIATYKNEKKGKSDDEYRDFLEWLGNHKHQEVVELLNLNAKTSISIKALLNQDRAILLDKLESIDKMLAVLSSQIDGFSDLAAAIKPGVELSDQAIGILRQLEEAEASTFLVGKYMGGHILMHMLDGNGSQVDYDEPRFLEDDFNNLVSYGLLLQDYNGKGQPVYRITRLASKLVKLTG